RCRVFREKPNRTSASTESDLLKFRKNLLKFAKSAIHDCLRWNRSLPTRWSSTAFFFGQPGCQAVPVGFQLLTTICPKHSLEQCSINISNWCFLCCKGGSFICSETCLTTFHLECR
ncbi:hypothetical protein pipiens_000183, partial [Culex pipiens pipiens]